MSKYITGFDYADKILTVFLTIISGLNIFSHIKTKKHTRLMSSVFFVFFFCLSVGIIKKLLYETKKRNKSHNKVLYLGKNKLDCIEMLISQSIMDLNISHDEFKMIINEKKTMIIKKNTMNKGEISDNVNVYHKRNMEKQWCRSNSL